MTDVAPAGDDVLSPAEGAEIAPAVWEQAVHILGEKLAQHHGCVSSMALRSALEKAGIADARAVVVRLKYFEPTQPLPAGFAAPSFRWRSHAKSIYSEERFAALEKETQQEAEQQAAESVAPPAGEPQTDEDESPPPERRRNRQEEGRLGTYVMSILEDIYQSECAPDESPYVFDVHSERAGTDFENVDLMAVSWRSESIVEIVTVEVKLEFNVRLVQQARNYCRFSDRVWLAVPVSADFDSAGSLMRESDPLLFEHVVESGLGILACRRRPGRSYDVAPLHWPRRLRPDPVEREAFMERYRKHLEKAGVLERRRSRNLPSLG